MAVPRIYHTIFFHEYTHGTHIDTDAGSIAAVRIKIHFKENVC